MMQFDVYEFYKCRVACRMPLKHLWGQSTYTNLSTSSVRSRMVFLHIPMFSFYFPPQCFSVSFHFSACPSFNSKLKKKKNPNSNAETRRHTFLQTTTMHTALEILSLISGRNFQNSYIYLNKSVHKRQSQEKHLCIYFDQEKFSHINNKKTNHTQPSISDDKARGRP